MRILSTKELAWESKKPLSSGLHYSDSHKMGWWNGHFMKSRTISPRWNISWVIIESYTSSHTDFQAETSYRKPINKILRPFRGQSTPVMLIAEFFFELDLTTMKYLPKTRPFSFFFDFHFGFPLGWLWHISIETLDLLWCAMLCFLSQLERALKQLRINSQHSN